MLKTIIALISMINLCFLFFVQGDFGGQFVQDPWKNSDFQQNIEPDGIVKTMTKNGDISTCVNIYEQPSLSHPLLRNHTIQLEPTIIPNEIADEPLFREAKTSGFDSIVHTCPPGYIPIRKVEKRSFEDSTRNTQNDSLLYRFALLEMIHYPGEVFYGGSAQIKLDNPHCENGQSSGGSIWIASGLSDQRNVIKAGWMVNPDVYGDTHTHFSVYWTSDGFHKTGCHDILCPGFIQVDRDVILGVTLVTENVHESRSWTIMFFYVFQDISTQHWWLVTYNPLVRQPVYIGYWPKELFTRFGQGATVVNFGGSVMTRGGQPFPPMGDGSFPDGRKTDSNYFERIQYVNESYYHVPHQSSHTKLQTDNPSCYGLVYTEQDKDSGNRHTLFMGGPGGRC